MIVDSSYLPWVRPTRRVHLALSVGMTVTGVLLVATGILAPARPSPALGWTADTAAIATDTSPAGTLLPLPIARPAAPGATPPNTNTSTKSHRKPRPHPRPTALAAPAVPAITAPLPAPLPQHPPKR